MRVRNRGITSIFLLIFACPRDVFSKRTHESPDNPVGIAAISATGTCSDSTFLTFRGGSDDETKTGSLWTSWSSLLDVDPSKILSILVKHGGLIMHKYVEKDLKNAAKLCRCDVSKLNVMNRQLILHNFTVSLPGARSTTGRSLDPALRVGKIKIEWDSYLQPCVSIQLADVDVTVEFINLLLTKSNWNELNNAGFPPEMILASNEEDAYESSTFVRVGRLDLDGNVTVRIRSRIMDKSLCPDVVFDLTTLRDLSAEIRKESNRNKRKNSAERGGVTTDELYEIVQNFFETRLMAAVEAGLSDIAASRMDSSHESVTVEQANKLLSSAKHVFENYAQNAGSAINGSVDELVNKVTSNLSTKVDEHIKKVGENLNSRLHKIGGVIDKEQADALRRIGRKQSDRLREQALGAIDDVAKRKGDISMSSVVKAATKIEWVKTFLEIDDEFLSQNEKGTRDSKKTLHGEIEFLDW